MPTVSFLAVAVLVQRAMLERRDRLKMLRVEAGRVVARVMDMMAFGDRPNPQFVGRAMRAQQWSPLPTGPDQSVPVGVASASEVPASSRLIHCAKSQEAFFQ